MHRADPRGRHASDLERKFNDNGLPGHVAKQKVLETRMPAMSDDAVDYGGSRDAESLSEGDQVPSRLPARAESLMIVHFGA